MESFDKSIIAKLISDTGFIKWVKGKPVGDPKKWEDWTKQNPNHREDFQEAKRLVNELSVNSSTLADDEIKYLWHKASMQMPKQKERPSLLFTLSRIAAILFIPLIIYTAFDISGFRFKNGQAVNEETPKVIVDAPIGARSLVNLSDGTQVWLNAGSKLFYPAQFAANERRVRILGEGYFSVTKSKSPFYVENQGPTVKVYGTEFNVNSYEDEDQVTIALVEGKIALQINDQEEFLEPGQVSFYHKTQKQINIEDSNMDQYVGWKEGKYIFRNSSLGSISKVLQRKFNITFQFNDLELKNYKYNAQFQDESLTQIMELLKISAPIEYSFVRRNNLSGEATDKVIVYKR